PQSYTEAAKLYRKAADQGDNNAEYSLGSLYSQGKGVPQDYTKAIKWLSRASEHGDAQAQAALAVLYYDGKGTPRNIEEACFWLILANGKNDEFGNRNTATLLGKAIKELSPKSLASILKRIKKWVPVLPAPPHGNMNYSLP
ncbi:MAG: sel1 repeat family protein, partial [Alphaproteobacteria bacterium]|nr:sel1 repeat family protein [Alphaproteobacteria bacterium]